MSEDQLQPQDSLDDRGVDDVLDEGYSPPDREPANLRDPDGPDTLEERLDEETPEVWEQAEEGLDDDVVDGPVRGEVGTERTGRLAAPDEGLGPDETEEMIATDEGIAGAGASAEEAAVHTIE